jgi:hypothetical protein
MLTRTEAFLLACMISGCSDSPSRNILGSYFPFRMVCDPVGLAAALAARVALKAFLPKVGRYRNWVVVAQPFPVWVRLDSLQSEALHVGMTASVKVHHGNFR